MVKAKYAEVYEALVERISQMNPGDRLESEVRLASSFNVAPMTVRRALMLLSQEGLTVGMPGRGTYVAQPEQKNEKDSDREAAGERADSPSPSSTAQKTPETEESSCGNTPVITGENMVWDTLLPETQASLLSATIEPADDAERAMLNLDEGAFIVRIIRLHKEIPALKSIKEKKNSGEKASDVIGVETALIDASEFHGLLGCDLTGSLTGLLLREYAKKGEETELEKEREGQENQGEERRGAGRAAGQTPLHSRIKISAGLATYKEAHTLGVELPHACLRVESTLNLGDKRTVALLSTVLRGDKIELEF